MRVLHVIDSLHTGGAEQLLLNLTRHIDADCFDLAVASLDPADDAALISTALQAEGTSVYRAIGLRRRDPRHLAWLTALIRREGIDLVHTHLAYGNIVGLLAAGATGRTAVATIHSTQDRHGRFAWVKRRLQREAVRRRAAVVIACSPEVARSARHRFGIANSRLVLLPNAIDARAYGSSRSPEARACRNELLAGRQGPLLIAVGSITSVKAHEHLVDATAELVHRYPGLRLVIAGRDGDNADSVRARILARSLADHVCLLGECGDVAAMLAAADLFVHAARREGLPLSILEAMASGVPVVSTSLGGIPSHVDHGRLAVVTGPDDHRSLSAAISHLLAHRVEAGEQARRAQAYVQSNHNVNAWTRALESIYTGLAAARATAS